MRAVTRPFYGRMLHDDENRRVDSTSDLTDDQLVARIRQLNQQLEQAGVDLWQEEPESGASADEPVH